MTEVVVPDFSEDIEEITVNNWYFEEGDAVQKGDNLVEVTTGSSTYQIAAPVSGIVSEIFFEEGDDVEVGEVIATIEPE